MMLISGLPTFRIPVMAITEHNNTITDELDNELLSSFISDTYDNNFIVPVIHQQTAPVGFKGIYTAQDLLNINDDLDGSYILMNDIDVSTWNREDRIGRLGFPDRFRGVLDGNGYVIKNLNSQGGLFTALDGAKILNLGLVDGIVVVDVNRQHAGETDRVAGGLADYSFGAEIYNCFNAMTVTSANLITGVSSAGGLIGQANSCTITSSYNIGSVNGLGEVGGLVGGASGDMSIIDCYNKGTITSNSLSGSNVGGLIGHAHNFASDTFGLRIHNSYNAGSINIINHQNSLVGEILGTVNGRATLNNCYWLHQHTYTEVGIIDESWYLWLADFDVSTNNVSALSIPEMRQQTSFTGFDFDAVWGINPNINNGFPYLRANPPVENLDPPDENHDPPLDNITVTWNVADEFATVNPSTESKTPRERMGRLPIPSLPGSAFIGWFDTDGNRITETSIVPDNDVIYSARWTYRYRHMNTWYHSTSISFRFLGGFAGRFWGGTATEQSYMRKGMDNWNYYWNNGSSPIRFFEDADSENIVTVISSDDPNFGALGIWYRVSEYAGEGSTVTQFFINMYKNNIDDEVKELGFDRYKAFTSVFAHELGHAAGLEDGNGVPGFEFGWLGGSEDSSVMNNVYTNLNTVLGPTEYDIESVNILYSGIPRAVAPLDIQNEGIDVMQISASYPSYRSIAHLASRATDVVRVEVLDERVERFNTWLETPPPEINPYYIYTVYRLRVIDAFKSDATPGDILEVRQLGGQQDNEKVINTNKAPITVGDDLVLFMRASYIDNYPSVFLNPFQTVYRFTDTGTLESVHPGNHLTLTVRDLMLLSEGTFQNAPTVPTDRDFPSRPIRPGFGTSPAQPPSTPAPTPVPTLTPTPASAPTPSKVSVADTLYRLNLFVGTGTDSDGNPIFELERQPTRLEALALVVRLMGLQQEAMTFTGTNNFTDVPAWGAHYAAYGYHIGITVGTNDDHTEFTPNRQVTAHEFTTFLLRILGYSEANGDFLFEEAMQKASIIGFFSPFDITWVSTDNFLRYHAIHAMVNALLTIPKDSNEYLLHRLASQGVFTREDADWFVENISS